jgi:uncharacterized repeat protein (TIGR03803 family)
VGPSACLAFAITLTCQIASAQTFTNLHTFSGGTDGGFAFASPISDPAGNLYGTTYQGGDHDCDPSNPGRGCGVIYRVDNAGNETVLYSFRGLPDAEFPRGRLVRDAAGNLYGTTVSGGAHNRGAVFRVDSSGKETVLYSFTGGKDGDQPYAGLVRDSAGNLYGTTLDGGNLACVIQRTGAGCGVVFKVNASGKEVVLHRFSGNDGAWPQADLLLDPAGNLYGTTYTGTTNAGTVFRIDRTGTFSVLHRFGAKNDGFGPRAGLIRDGANNLYGTTESGGSSGQGTVYKIDKAGHETTLYSFTQGTDGFSPQGALVRDRTGNLYGTTMLGGDPSCNGGTGCGAIFKLDASGHESVLHTFEGSPGEFPQSRLVINGDGTLFGTTAGNDLANFGSVFEFKP